MKILGVVMIVMFSMAFSYDRGQIAGRKFTELKYEVIHIQELNPAAHEEKLFSNRDAYDRGYEEGYKNAELKFEEVLKEELHNVSEKYHLKFIREYKWQRNYMLKWIADGKPPHLVDDAYNRSLRGEFDYEEERCTK